MPNYFLLLLKSLINIASFLSSLINIKSLLSSLIGAFCGALFAYCFNIHLQRTKERNEQVIFVTYMIASMSGVVDSLYNVKKIFIIPRKKQEQCWQQENIKELSIETLKEIVTLIQANKFALPFSMEKISFLAGKSPNIIHLISRLSLSLDVLNQTISDYNQYLLKAVDNRQTQLTSLFFSYSKNLEEQLDESLYFSERTQEVLIQYGSRFFGRDFKITSNVVAKKWVSLKPPKIDSWEEVEFFPKKKTLIEKIRL